MAKTLIVLVVFYVAMRTSAATSCIEVKKKYEKTCLEAQDTHYMQCMKTRMKRHYDDCQQSDGCYDCNCEYCSYSQCRGQCDGCCNSCCTNYIQCHTNHCCHKQCHSECRTYDCRSNCRKSCFQTVQSTNRHTINEHNVVSLVGEVDKGTSIQKTEEATNNWGKHNVTTIINLTNVLNNTMNLDIPVNLNYTTTNNLTFHEASLTEGRGVSDNCCIVIGPRQCVPTKESPYTKCFHTRARQCGSYCSANIVHQENRQICNSVDNYGQPANCQKQISYIPQPQPKCTYTSSWPYVSCSIQPPTSCEGCYGHYSNSEQTEYKSCSPQCYDDFSVGPLYRQGPFYQQSYSHVPPCMYSPSGCGGFPGNPPGFWPGINAPTFPQIDAVNNGIVLNETNVPTSVDAARHQREVVYENIPFYSQKEIEIEVNAAELKDKRMRAKKDISVAKV